MNGALETSGGASKSRLNQQEPLARLLWVLSGRNQQVIEVYRSEEMSLYCASDACA